VAARLKEVMDVREREWSESDARSFVTASCEYQRVYVAPSLICRLSAGRGTNDAVATAATGARGPRRGGDGGFIAKDGGRGDTR
jgi:hypothetical protein